jgi:hypothetical protein
MVLRASFLEVTNMTSKLNLVLGLNDMFWFKADREAAKVCMMNDTLVVKSAVVGRSMTLREDMVALTPVGTEVVDFGMVKGAVTKYIERQGDSMIRHAHVQWQDNDGTQIRQSWLSARAA